MIRIAITGPESTGKSSLAEALARELNGRIVPEYARAYLDDLGRPYELHDVLRIGRQQYEMIMEACDSSVEAVIADTELLVISIWLSHKYGHTEPWIENRLARQPFDLYLLCDIDLPWEEDPQREHPHMRQYFFELYHKRLTDLDVPFGVVQGEGEDRIKNALALINALSSCG
ncbi:MAG: ATP-binding protein [Bacteroidales bacterium]